jgi:hypothetical protein
LEWLLLIQPLGLAAGRDSRGPIPFGMQEVRGDGLRRVELGYIERGTNWTLSKEALHRANNF